MAINGKTFKHLDVRHTHHVGISSLINQEQIKTKGVLNNIIFQFAIILPLLMKTINGDLI